MSATRLNGSHDIILGQAAILASALDARRINAMLQHQATNGWRERQRGGSAFVLRWLRRFGGRGRGRGSSGGCRRRSSTGLLLRRRAATFLDIGQESPYRSDEHTSELQSLMRISYAVFRLKKKNI